MTKLAQLIAAGALGAALVTGQPLAAEDRAIIVGINTYAYLPDANLNGARPDALRFRDMVQNSMGLKPSQITLLLDGEATRKNVIDAIVRDLKFHTKPGDRLIFYFSGHGSSINDRDGDESDGKDEVLVLADAGRKGTFGLLPDDDLGYLFERFKDRRIMVVVDACHSGTITRNLGESDEQIRLTMVNGEGPPPPLPQSVDVDRTSQNKPAGLLIPGQGHMDVWSAASAAEIAIENRRGGIFTNLFLAGLGDKKADLNRNGIVSNAELLAFVRAGSANFCRNSKLCQTKNQGRLTPYFSGAIERNAAFSGLPVSAPVAEPAPVPAPILQPPPTATAPVPAPGPTVQAPPTPAPVIQTPPASSLAQATPEATPTPTPSQGASAGANPPSAPSQTQDPTPPAPPPAQPPAAPSTDIAAQDVAQPAPAALALADTNPPPPPGQDDPPANQTGAGPVTVPPLDDLPPILDVVTPAAPFGCTDMRQPDGTAKLEDLFLPNRNQAVSLSIDKGTDLAVGQTVLFDAQTNRGGRLMVFDLTPDCELYQIFPSPLSPDRADIQAEGGRVKIPSALSANGQPIVLRVTEPAGRGHLLAVLVEDPNANVQDLMPPDSLLQALPDGVGHLTKLANGLNDLVYDSAGVRPSRWHATVLPYTITR